MDAYNSSSNLSLLAPPTTFLPPLSCLSDHSAQCIQHAIQQLRDLYWPTPPMQISLPKRTIATRIHDNSVPDSGYASAEEDEDECSAQKNSTAYISVDLGGGHDGQYDLEILRSDALERGFAIKWITGFVARSDKWINLSPYNEEQYARARLLDEATSVLSAFLGDDGGEEEAMTRSFSFLGDYGSTIKVELNDTPPLEDDYTSVGLQSWGSSILLAERICASPAEFSLCTGGTKPLRILELGAGTGLLSIAVAKLLHAVDPVVIATDYHPDVLINLAANVTTNFPSVAPPVAVHALDWEFPMYPPPLDGTFDVVLGADVIYHPKHAQLIKGCLEQLLAPPGNRSEDGGICWLIMALRTTGRHEGLDDTVAAVFPDLSEAPQRAYDTMNTQKLAILERIEVERHKGIGRADESGYMLFKIGWVDSSQ